MIMKLNVSNELKSRLMHAAENGSVIAKDILLEVKKNVPVEEIIRGTYNCFSTKRKRTEAGTFKKIRIVFTACSKDLAHPSFPDRNNPQAPWFPENRTVLEPSTFVELFKNLPKYSPDEINYFCSALSLDSKVTVRLHESMNDFMEAYLESNYSPISDSDTSSLHSSCMRYEDKARNAADFYTNFAGAKILVARDESNNILGRAVVWNEVTLWKSINTPIAASLLDRIYSSHAFVAELIRKQAQEAGILFSENYDGLSPDEMLPILRDKIRGAQIHRMVVTMGAQGAVFATLDGEDGYCPAKKVDVKDTTGAGDAFFAGAVIGQTYGKTMMESCEIGTRLAASVITTGENVCPRYLPSEFGLDVPTVDDAQIALEL